MSVKTLKPRMYCTPIDVREWHRELTEELINDNQIEKFILRATAMVNLHLFKTYTANALIATSWCGVPTIHNDNDADEDAVLYGGSAGASAYTEQWKITCATSTFSVTGNLQGSFSDCAYTSHFTATDLSISASSWSATPKLRSVFYMCTYDRYLPIVEVTAMLAAGYALASKYSENVPNANAFATKLQNDAIDMLERMSDPYAKNFLAYDTGARISSDHEPVATPYEIDEEGTDVTKYYPNRESQKGETALSDD